MKRLPILLLTATLAACAPRPDAIAPVSMAGAFDGTACTQARTMLATEQDTLASLSAAQNQAATGDLISVVLIGVPVSSLSGEDRAASKGKIAALESRVAGCQ
jgi:hypothetical protein